MGLIRELGGALAHARCTVAQTQKSDGPVGIYLYKSNSDRAMCFVKCTVFEFFYADWKQKNKNQSSADLQGTYQNHSVCFYVHKWEHTLCLTFTLAHTERWDEILGGGGVSLTVAPEALAHGMGGKTNANVSQPTSTHV